MQSAVWIEDAQNYHSLSEMCTTHSDVPVYLCNVKLKKTYRYGKGNNVGAFLEITMKINENDRAAAAAVYTKYRQPFLDDIEGAHCKHLLVRGEDVQVLHGFASVADAENYLKSDLFTQDVVVELKPYFQSEPDVRIYSVVG